LATPGFTTELVFAAFGKVVACCVPKLVLIFDIGTALLVTAGTDEVIACCAVGLTTTFA
jgi:hypothetical protein